MDEKISSHLADNLKALRAARGLSQQRAAGLAEIPRPTWAQLESGAGNPTLHVLVRAATALAVTVEELIGPPRQSGRIYDKDALKTRVRGDVTVRELIPEALPGLQLERMELAPGAHMKGAPHTPGTREYLACERGKVSVFAGGERHDVGAGSVLVFRGDQKHSYQNPGRSTAVAYSVVVIAPGAP